MALDQAIDILNVLVPIAKAVPILGAPVEGSLEALSRILEFAQGVKSTKRKTEELAVQAARWLKIVFDVLKEVELKADHSELEGLRPNMEELHKALIAIVQFTEHCAKQGTLVQTMRKYKDEEELSKLGNALEAAFRRFQIESHIRIEKTLKTLLTTDNTILKTTNTILTTTNSILPTTNTILTTTSTILPTANTILTTTQTLLTVAETETLKCLRPVSSARYNSRESPGGCLENTRGDVLSSMLSWLTEPSSPSSSMSIFWLAGLAGTGKSTILKTLCQRVSSDDKFLLASFFASRNSAERRDPYRILHTFAYQLAITNDRIRPHVFSAVRAPQDVMQEPMLEQIKQLLAEPIEKAQLRGCTIVFVIDALDECQKSAAGVEGGPLVSLLVQALENQPVKLLVASRQESSIVNIFRSLSHIPLRLHEIESAIVEADVRRIYSAGFADIRKERAHDVGTEHWPTEAHLNTLVHLTGPLFIYAATVLKFVGAPRFVPQKQLTQVLERGSSVAFGSSTVFSQIDALYMSVLQSATADMIGTSLVDARLCQRVGDLLRTVVLLEEPVSIRALAHLMDVGDDVQEVDNDVRALASVLLISHKATSIRFSETVSTFHPSFRDFLVDPQRCSDKQFLVTPAIHQHDLLYRCLRLLNENLCYDICGIRNPGRANATIQDLSRRLAHSVPEAVRYACQFWPVHLVAGGSLAEPLCTALLEFCSYHLLHWLEVLSLLGDLSSAGRYLPRAVAWCQGYLTNSPPMQDISLLLRDAHRVVRGYATPIMTHALQIYSSALATGPGCKLLSSAQSGQIVAPRLMSERASDWSPILQVFEGHTGSVTSVACSLDGSYIISGSYDRTVRLWNARTGERHAVLEGHRKIVQSVAFSPDETRIVSGSDDETVRVWDARTGRELSVIDGHSDSVRSVAFSPNGAHIVSGSVDATVRVWDAQTGKELFVLKGHGWAVLSVAFSPGGAHIVSGSDDESVRIWDACTGKVLTVLEGHSKSVLSVAFSPDGAHIVSGSADNTVRVWDAQTGRELAVLKGHSDRVRSVAFSPDGAHITSASGDKTVRVWDAQTSKELAVLQGHRDWVWSVAFSPDGVHIISGSFDSTVRVWDVQTGNELAVLEGHRMEVRSVAFSPDGAHIVSGSEDQTVRVWDAQTGKQLAVLNGHSLGVGHVAVSRDGEIIYSNDHSGRHLSWKARDLGDGELVQGLGSSNTSLPPTSNEALVWNEDTGWISWQCSDDSIPLHLCWLPIERRGAVFACHGTTAVIGARQGIITVLEFSNVIAMLKSLY